MIFNHYLYKAKYYNYKMTNLNFYLNINKNLSIYNEKRSILDKTW